MKSNLTWVVRPVFVVVLLLTLTVTAYAAWSLLSPGEVANRLEYPVLAAAFENDDAVLINESQTQNGYTFTFVGLVSGQGLTSMDESVDAEKTYAVIAISPENKEEWANANGEYASEPFFISPLIKGQTPWLVNIASMGGAYSSFVDSGIQYRLIECDSLEIFADRGLTLCVSSSTFYDINAFDYDEATGLVTPRADYDGVNLLFDLPLDPAKADFEKAEAYLNELLNPSNDSEEEKAAAAEERENRPKVVTKEDMTRESFIEWMEEQLAEGRKMIENGEYSEAALALDRGDYEKTLKEIENGAKVTLFLLDDGSYNTRISYPESGLTDDVELAID